MSRRNEGFKRAQHPIGRWGERERVHKYSSIGPGKEWEMRIFIDSYIWHDGAKSNPSAPRQDFHSEVDLRQK